MKKKTNIILGLSMLLIFTGCQTKQEVELEEPETIIVKEVVKEVAVEVPKEEDKKRIIGPFKEMIAPDFTLNDLDGNAVTLSDLKGNAVALVFWTSW